MKAKKSLRKLTETDRKIDQLLTKKKILRSDVDALLSDNEMGALNEVLTKMINEYKGIQKDKLLKQIDEIIPIDTKNQLWENNHYDITTSMAKLIEEYGKMPTKNQIADDTGLSRQTIYKHLAGYATHPLYTEQFQQFKFMADRVLGKVIKAASLGDMKAARLYFDIMGNMNNGQSPNNTSIKNQNNYIQINGTVLRQEIIKHLNPEQLNSIETILKTALPKAEILQVAEKNG